MMHTYQEAFISMNPIFIGACFIEFVVFTSLALRLTCKYLPIFNTQNLAILMAFMMCYLIQAALFLRTRKYFGP
jgi:hypothetical protein